MRKPRQSHIFLQKNFATSLLGSALLFFSVVALGAGAASAEPLPPSPAEQRAAQLALELFEHGPEAVWPVLSSKAQLRAMGKEAALAEVEARIGTTSGATWHLRTPGPRHRISPEQAAAAESPQWQTAIFDIELPSGLDDTLQMDWVEENGEWKLHRLRCAADPRTIRGDLGVVGLGSAIPSTPSPAKGSPGSPQVLLFVAAFSMLALLWVAGGLLSTRRFGRSRTALCAGPLVAITILALALASCDALRELGTDEGSGEGSESPGLGSGAPGTTDPDALPSLARLLPLRLAMAGATAADPLAIDIGDAGAVTEAAKAWQAQALLELGRLPEADAILDSLPEPSALPLVERLRARSALRNGRVNRLAEALDTALDRGADSDGLRLEAVVAYFLGGQEDRAEIMLELMTRMGSRMAEVYYLSSRFAFLADRPDDADTLFRLGWELEPISRLDLFDDPLLAHIATRPAVFTLFHFGDTAEPSPVAPGLSATPLRGGQGLSASILGARLQVEYGDARLVIPGGATLAPAGTVIESAADAQARETREALGRLSVLTAAASRPGGLAHPARRRQASVAAEALALDRRWEDLIALTDGLVDASAAPPDLVKLRAQAMLEEGRDVEAKNLLIRLAENDLANRRRDPTTLYQLAEMFVRSGDYDWSLRLIDKANRLSPRKVSARRVRQIEMDRDLDANFLTYESEHFALRYPAATGSEYPEQLALVLEAEWKRLAKWIPVRGKHQVEIHLFPAMEFLQAYSSGVIVLGIYDGKVRVPLADIKSFHPELVNILSHEMSHAMIDIATAGNAPKWLHEGLASHLEMAQLEVNPIPDMHEAGKDLSFALIEPILKGFGEPQLVGMAYRHATWALHYVEAEHGVRAIHRLLDAFRQGLDTPAALKKVFGMSVADFDRRVRDWCLADAPDLWPTELIRYDRAFDSMIARDSQKRGAIDTSKLVDRAPKTQPRATRDIAAEMKAWHPTYLAKSKPVKVRLGRTLAILEGKAEGNLAESCRQLASQVAPLLSDPKALAAPKKHTGDTLREAYESLYRLTDACQRGHSARLQQELKKATGALGRAQKQMAIYGLEP